MEHHLRSSTIQQLIIFYRDLPRVDFRTQVDWQELGSPEAGVPNLKAAFTARLSECQAWFETPFAAVQRPVRRPGSACPALGGCRRADYGIAVLNDSKYAYDALGTRLRLTLVRSGYEPDSISDWASMRSLTAFSPSGGLANRRGGEGIRGFNQPLLGRLVSAGSSGEYFRAEEYFRRQVDFWRPQVSGSPSVLPACLKPAYHGSGKVLRLYESAGIAGEVELSGFTVGCQVWETNVTEDKLSECTLVDGRLRLAFRPWQVRTFLIEITG